MARRDTLGLSAVRTEGAILPPSILVRIHAEDPGLPGLKPLDYGLSGERIREAASRAWNGLQPAWQSFQHHRSQMAPGDQGAAMTRTRWLNQIMKALDYGSLDPLRSQGVRLDDRDFPVSHMAGRTPIHLVGCGLDLDARTPGAAGAARMTPHGIVQLLLNGSDEHLWGFVSNGLRWRILRDSQSLSRQAMVEFDLEAIFEGRLYDEFRLFYLLCHQTSVAAPRPEECRLEQWTQTAVEEGKRALDSLRDGVQASIESLGQGFLRHPANTALQDRVRSGALDKQEYYRQLLRLVYRLLFLSVAEDRNVLLHPEAPDAARRLYNAYYSTQRLRLLAERLHGSSRHHDLYAQLKLVLQMLSRDGGCPELGLPALGGFLFSDQTAPDLDAAHLANADLLQAVRCLAVTEEGGRRARVDYKNLGSEELGSVYESLLELHPDLDSSGSHFELKGASGNERKSTGSYYTPDCLIQCLLDTALDPVVEERLAEVRRVASGEWRRENGEWRVASGEWRRGNGEWRVVVDAESGEWRVVVDAESGEWRVVSGETPRGGGVRGNRELSRSRGMAAGTGDLQAGLHADQVVSSGGGLRDDLADPQGGRLDPGQHRRGLGQTLPGGAAAVPPDGQRQQDRTGDASDHQRGRGALHGGGDPADSAGDNHPRPAAGGPGTQPASPQPLTTHHSPLATRHSPLPTPHSPLPTHHSPPLPLATRYSLLASHALLSLRIIDPAVGSGHFLIAAAHRLARRLAQVRTGDEEPAPPETRRALRDVIGRCLYGVDLNPMAAELCKVALWMEALEPGKPLSFLDHHICAGNSLLGATAELVAEGIPDGAYDAIEGDDKAACAALKKRNKSEREGQGNLFAPEAFAGQNLRRTAAALEQMGDESLAGVKEKERRFRELQRAAEMRRLTCDAWCAAFTLPKGPGKPEVTTATLWATTSGTKLEPKVDAAIRAEAERLRFFHPQVAWPDLFDLEAGGGGFDVVLGNPPWEHTELKEKEFFAVRAPNIATAKTGAERKRLIAALERNDPELHKDFTKEKRLHDATGAFCGNSGRFPLCGRGRINTYAVFSELERDLVGEAGRAGIVVPSGIATDDTTKHFFADLMTRNALVSLYDFENGMRDADDETEEEPTEEAPPKRRRKRTATGDRRLFPGVHASFKFSLLTMRAPAPPLATRHSPLAAPHSPLATRRSPLTAVPHSPLATPHSPPTFAFFCHRPTDLHLPGKVFTLSADDIALLNPNTRTCPVFRTQRDAEITRAIYRRVPVLVREGDPNGNPWGVGFKQGLFNMTSDSGLFRTREELEAAGGALVGNRWNVPKAAKVDGKPVQAGEWLPLYEAKMTAAFDHRAADVVKSETAVTRQNQPRAISSDEKRRPDRLAMPMSWIHREEYDATQNHDVAANLGFFDVTSPTNMRTMIASIVPAVPAGHKLPLIHPRDGSQARCLVIAALNAFIFDYIARQKVANTSFTFFYLKQLPLLPPSVVTSPARWHPNASVASWLVPRVLELTYTAHDLAPFARDLGYNGPPFVWDEERRFLLRAELDAAFFHLYGIGRDDVDYIMETFPIVKRKDLAAHGRYRTKEQILRVYDAMQRAVESGVAYEGVEVSGEWRVASGERQRVASGRVASGERQRVGSERVGSGEGQRVGSGRVGSERVASGEGDGGKEGGSAAEAFELVAPPARPAPRTKVGARISVKGKVGVVQAVQPIEGGWRYVVLFDGEEKARGLVDRKGG